MAKMTQVADNFWVAHQLDPADIDDLASGGFKTILNNRPDDEEAGQPGAEAVKRAAAAKGIGYRHIPVTSPTIDRAAVDAVGAAVREAPGPIVAHCRSGTRSYLLWAANEVLQGRATAAGMIAAGATRGYDLTGLIGVLERVEKK